MVSEPPAEGDDGVDVRNDALARLLGDPLVWDEPPAGLEDQVVAAIAAEAAGQQGSSPATAPAPGGAVVTSRRPWARPFLAGVGAAAAIVLLVAGVALFAGGEGEDDRGGTEVALAGTELAPEASADALVADTPLGTVLHLDVRDLPPAPEGAFYEVWMRQEGDDGDAVSAGTFHMRGGDGEVELWSGVPPERYPVVTVTLQQEGEGPESSGQVVLRGTVEP
jgi:hypothetical protein